MDKPRRESLDAALSARLNRGRSGRGSQRGSTKRQGTHQRDRAASRLAPRMNGLVQTIQSTLISKVWGIDPVSVSEPVSAFGHNRQPPKPLLSVLRPRGTSPPRLNPQDNPWIPRSHAPGPRSHYDRRQPLPREFERSVYARFPNAPALALNAPNPSGDPAFRGGRRPTDEHGRPGRAVPPPVDGSRNAIRCYSVWT
jgi:hypothetical protein